MHVALVYCRVGHVLTNKLESQPSIPLATGSFIALWICFQISLYDFLALLHIYIPLSPLSLLLVYLQFFT
jgi:hypothetical protein